jgi:hypothetical protein
VDQFRYLGTTLTIKIPFMEKLKSVLNSGNACYHLVQNPLSSSLPSKNVKTEIYGPVIMPVRLYGHKIWSLRLREEHRLRVFGDRVLRKIFGPKRDEVTRVERTT